MSFFCFPWSIAAFMLITRNRAVFSFLNSMVGSETKGDVPKDETINVFSVASGHLYERFLR